MPKIDKKIPYQPDLLSYRKGPPEKGYIWRTNGNDLMLGLIYSENIIHNHVFGWMPESLWENDPIEKLMSLTHIGEQPKDIDLLAYQYVIIAIIHDQHRMGYEKCGPLYFKNKDDLHGRIVSRFIERLRCYSNSEAVIATLNFALRSVKLDIEKQTPGGDNKTGTNEFEIDFKKTKFRKSKSLQLLNDLIDCPSGVSHNVNNHGTDQPKTLITVLNDAGYREISGCIHKEKGRIYLENARIIKK